MLMLAAPPRGLFTMLDSNATPVAWPTASVPGPGRGLEWANTVLMTRNRRPGREGPARRDALFDSRRGLRGPHLVVMERFEARPMPGAGPGAPRAGPGEELFRQGEDPRGAYMVLHGTLAVMATYAQSAPQRIRSRGPGTLAAPMAALRAYVAPGTAVAEGRTVGGGLPREALARLEEADPKTALAFHKLVARALGRRAEGR
jgi:hypothetical protein